MVGKAYGAVVSVNPIPTVGGGDDVAAYGGYLVGESMLPDMARRVAACLNVCAGIETDALEKMPHPFSELLSKEFGQVVLERDQLLSALEKYEQAFDSLFAQCNPISNAWGEKVDMTLLNEAHQAADRAILLMNGGEK